MQRTKIEYLTHTWNPLAMRCTRVSEGCANCWHLGMLKRMVANPMIPADRKAAYQGGPPVLIEKELAAPLRARKPAIIGVQFMGDLFHDDVPDKYIDRIFAAMALCPQHRFLVLTKRPKRMREYMSGVSKIPVDHERDWLLWDAWRTQTGQKYGAQLWPLPNIRFGTTAENQPMADLRIAELVKLKALFPEIITWASIEPMLSAIRLDLGLGLIGGPGDLDWIVCGGESGPGARPMHPDWPRSLRDQCQAAGGPFFFKQWGEHKLIEILGSDKKKHQKMIRVGKARAGRELDGREWNENPKGAP